MALCQGHGTIHVSPHIPFQDQAYFDANFIRLTQFLCAPTRPSPDHSLRLRAVARTTTALIRTPMNWTQVKALRIKGRVDNYDDAVAGGGDYVHHNEDDADEYADDDDAEDVLIIFTITMTTLFSALRLAARSDAAVRS